MRRISLTLFAVLFIAVPLAAEECCATKLDVTQKKVDGLILKWQAASKSLAVLPSEERTKLTQQLASVAKGCPVGSRMGETLAFVQQALTASIKADAECAKAGASGVKHEKLTAAFQARGKLLKALGELTAYSTAAMAGSVCNESKTQVAASQKEFCAQSAAKLAIAVRAESCPVAAAKLVVAAVPSLTCEKTVSSLVAQVKGAGCEKSAATLISAAVTSFAKSKTIAAAVKACGDDCAEKCCQETETKVVVAVKKAAGCCGSLAAKASLLLASWTKAPAEYAALGDQGRNELHSKLSAVMATNGAAKLLPETIMTLAEGLQVLVELEAYLLKTVKADAELAKSLAGEAGKGVERRSAVIAEASKIMSQARAVLQGALEPKTAD